MSYHNRRQSLDGVWEDLLSQGAQLFKQAQPALQVGAKILQDPYLPETACEITRLSNLEAGRAAGAACPRTSATQAQIAKGVGLRHAVTPLRFYIFHRQHPWVVPLAVAGVLGLTFWIGREVGKGRL